MNYLNFNREELGNAIILSGGLNEWLQKVSVDFEGFSDEWVTTNLVSILINIKEKLSSLHQQMMIATASNNILTYSHLGYLLSGVNKNKMAIIVQITQEDLNLKQKNIMQLNKLKEIEEIAAHQILGYDLCWLSKDIEIQQNKLYVYTCPKLELLEYVVRKPLTADDTITGIIEYNKLNPSRLHADDHLGYDLALMLIDSTASPAPTDSFGIQFPLPLGFNPIKPTLIQYDDDYWFYGNTDGKNWKTQKLDSSAAQIALKGSRVNFLTMQELKSPQSAFICNYIASIQGHTPHVERVRAYLPHILEILFNRGHILISPQERRKELICAMGLQFMKKTSSPERLVSFVSEANKRNLKEYFAILFSHGFSLTPTELKETLQSLKNRSLQKMQTISAQKGKGNNEGRIFENYDSIYTVQGLPQQFPWQFYELFLNWEQKQADLVRLIALQFILTSPSPSELETVNDCIEQYVKPHEERGYYALYFKRVFSDFSFPELPKDKPSLIQVDGIASRLVSSLPEKENIYAQMGPFYKIILRVRNDDASIDQFFYANKRKEMVQELTIDNIWFNEPTFKNILDQSFTQELKLIDREQYYHINMVIHFTDMPFDGPTEFFIYGNKNGLNWQYTALDFNLPIANTAEKAADGIYSDRGIACYPGFLNDFIYKEIKEKSGHIPSVFNMQTLKKFIKQSTTNSAQDVTPKQLSSKEKIALFNIKRKQKILNKSDIKINDPIEEPTKDKNDPGKMIGSGLKFFSGAAHFWFDGNKHETLRSNVVPYNFERSLKQQNNHFWNN